MEIAIIIALILLNGVFAMSEIALISARKSSLSNDIRHGSSTARIALKLANDPDKFLSTIQIGITLIGILTGIYSGDVLAADLGKILINAGVPATYAYLLAQILIVILVRSLKKLHIATETVALVGEYSVTRAECGCFIFTKTG